MNKKEAKKIAKQLRYAMIDLAKIIRSINMANYESKKKWAQQHADNRAFFCEHFPKGGIGAEIGVFYGQFSEIIIEVAKPKMLYLVDPWLYDDKFGNRTPEQIEEIYQEVREKFLGIDTFLDLCDIKIRRMTSREFLQSFIGCLDFVYIDGCHEADVVYHDLKMSWQSVKPGGIISGDDYGENIILWGDSVKRAVDDFCREKGITPELLDVPGEIGKQFLIRR